MVISEIISFLFPFVIYFVKMLFSLSSDCSLSTGIDLKEAEESLDVNKDSEILSVQDSNVLVENLMEVEVGVQEVSADSLAVDVLNKEAEKGLEVEVPYHSNNGMCYSQGITMNSMLKIVLVLREY